MATIVNTVIFTGSNQVFVVPPFVESIQLKVWGAGGGSDAVAGFMGFGGPGGFSTGILPVVAGDTLTLVVGEGGKRLSTVPTFGNGGAGGTDTFSSLLGSSGGGYSLVAQNGTNVIIAGGGGGAAGGTFNIWSNGGAGGGLTGRDGWVSTTAPPLSGPNVVGLGGSQVAGGAGGISTGSALAHGSAGLSLAGGAGGNSLAVSCGGGGGGGGGYFGGGGGAGQTDLPTSQDVAGGGGSSFLGPMLLSSSTQSTAQNTSQVVGPLLNPPQTSDPNYVTGVGVGSSSSAGGNGLIVLIYNQPDLILNKSVDRTSSDVSDTLTYTVSVRNSGNVTVTNINFIDTIPTGTTFINNSLTIDTAPSSNNPTPPGFNLSSLNPGMTTTISFRVRTGTTLPTPNPITNIASAGYTGGFVFNSNSVNTQVNVATIVSTKSTNLDFASIGDTITYTIVLRNNGNVSANNVVFKDTIPAGTTFISNSVNINTTTLPGLNPTPPGLTIPSSIGPNSVATITFNVRVTTIPSPNPIVNNATSSFNYLVNSSTTPNIIGSGSTDTNSVNTQVNNADLSTVSKQADKSYAICGDTLTYTINIPNSGNVTAINVVLVDTIPSSTSLVPNSVTVNGATQNGYDPSSGITIPNIAPGTSASVTFRVVIQC